MSGATGPYVEPKGRQDHYHGELPTVQTKSDPSAYMTIEDMRHASTKSKKALEEFARYKSALKMLRLPLPRLLGPYKETDVLPQDLVGWNGPVHDMKVHPSSVPGHVLAKAAHRKQNQGSHKSEGDGPSEAREDSEMVTDGPSGSGPGQETDTKPADVDDEMLDEEDESAGQSKDNVKDEERSEASADDAMDEEDEEERDEDEDEERDEEPAQGEDTDAEGEADSDAERSLAGGMHATQTGVHAGSDDAGNEQTSDPGNPVLTQKADPVERSPASNTMDIDLQGIPDHEEGPPTSQVTDDRMDVVRSDPPTTRRRLLRKGEMSNVMVDLDEDGEEALGALTKSKLLVRRSRTQVLGG